MTPSSPKASYDDEIGDMLWRCWRTLGTPATAQPVRSTLLDPEALIVLSAWIGNASEARIWIAATNWCAQNHRLISSARLTRIAASMPEDIQLPVSYFIDDVNDLSPSAKWRRGRGHEPHKQRTATAATSTKEPSPIRITDPSMARLKLRALVGAGARSEALIALISQNDSNHTSASVSRTSWYVQRHVKDALDELAYGGWVERWRDGREYQYKAHPSCLNLIEPHPSWVDWTDRIRALHALQVGALPLSLERPASAGRLIQAVDSAKSSFRNSRIALPDWTDTTSTAGMERIHNWIHRSMSALTALE